MIKLVIDRDIPFIKGVFEPYAEVVYLKGADISKADIADASGMIIRTRTRCNRELLDGTSVKFIATATIGTDHMDMEYCRAKGITVANAAGCNSGGVMQYVYTALFAIAARKRIHLHYGLDSDGGGRRTVLGVIGVGNVGGKVAALGEYLGFKVLRNDPPKEFRQTLDFNNGRIHLPDLLNYYSLDYLLEHSDIVTLHVPLLDTTRGLADLSFFRRMKQGAVFINSSRGEVVDEDALIKSREKLSALVLDVWNNEPDINRNLVDLCDIATPHIAGYSIEGKANGSLAAIRSAASFFAIEELEQYVIPESLYKNETPAVELYTHDAEANWHTLSDIFPIFDLDSQLRNNISDFEKIRSNYKLRREFYVNTGR